MEILPDDYRPVVIQTCLSKITDKNNENEDTKIFNRTSTALTFSISIPTATFHKQEQSMNNALITTEYPSTVF